MFKKNRPFIISLFIILLIVIGININWKRELDYSFEKISPHFLISDFATDSLKTGDVILRSGTGFYSSINRFVFSNSKKYSHVGIVSIENDTVFVYHALGGRESVTNQLRKDELLHYCNKKATIEVSFYRYNLSESQLLKVAELLKGLYKEQIIFDKNFDLEEDECLYHTEFVRHVLISVTDNNELIPVSSFLGKKYISIDNLYKNNNAMPLASFKFD